MNTLNLIKKQINKVLAALHDAQISHTAYRAALSMILVVYRVRKPMAHSAIAVRLTLSDHTNLLF